MANYGCAVEMSDEEVNYVFDTMSPLRGFRDEISMSEAMEGQMYFWEIMWWMPWVKLTYLAMEKMEALSPETAMMMMEGMKDWDIASIGGPEDFYFGPGGLFDQNDIDGDGRINREEYYALNQADYEMKVEWFGEAPWYSQEELDQFYDLENTISDEEGISKDDAVMAMQFIMFAWEKIMEMEGKNGMMETDWCWSKDDCRAP